MLGVSVMPQQGQGCGSMMLFKEKMLQVQPSLVSSLIDHFDGLTVRLPGLRPGALGE